MLHPQHWAILAIGFPPLQPRKISLSDHVLFELFRAGLAPRLQLRSCTTAISTLHHCTTSSLNLWLTGFKRQGVDTLLVQFGCDCQLASRLRSCQLVSSLLLPWVLSFQLWASHDCELAPRLRSCQLAESQPAPQPVLPPSSSPSPLLP